MNNTTNDDESAQWIMSPNQAMNRVPLRTEAEMLARVQRQTILQILRGEDKRLLVIIGPCSIDDKYATLEYAAKLAKLAQHHADTMYIVMRVYVEKPRTELGWQGLLSDPDINGSGDINRGICLSREIMAEVVELGLPVATEYVSPLIEPYLRDFVAWTAAGARSVESQLHRNFASGLAIPVGCKNSRNGPVDSAIAMMVAAANSQTYLGVDDSGKLMHVKTQGNPLPHLVLRGANGKPNYYNESLLAAEAKIHEKNLQAAIVVDCSHDNSGRDYRRQPVVAHDVVAAINSGITSVRGIMLESYLVSGKQPITDTDNLTYGQSITDCCLGWEDTESLLQSVADQLHAGERNE